MSLDIVGIDNWVIHDLEIRRYSHLAYRDRTVSVVLRTIDISSLCIKHAGCTHDHRQIPVYVPVELAPNIYAGMIVVTLFSMRKPVSRFVDLPC